LIKHNVQTHPTSPYYFQPYFLKDPIMFNTVTSRLIFRRAKFMAGAFAIGLVTLMSTAAAAAQITVDATPTGVTISRLGISGAGFAQVDFAESTAASRMCTNGIYYFNVNVSSTIDNTARRMMYNTLLAAQLAGKKVRYIYADKDDVSAFCYITILELVP
jgi:hypothetical protein